MKWKNHYRDCEYHFVTGSVGGYLPVFEDNGLLQLFIDAINNTLKSYGITMTAWVIMPEHYHLLIWNENGEQIKKFMQAVLSRSSSKILTFIKSQNIEKVYEWKFNRKSVPGKVKRNYLLTVFRNNANGKVTYSFWKEQCRGIPMWGAKKIKTHIDYIHANPLRRGLVSSPDDYKLSSYNYWYKGGEGLIPLSVADGFSFDEQ
ncbi:MAG: transposase [Candidatus Anammoxibacter sp.]